MKESKQIPTEDLVDLQNVGHELTTEEWLDKITNPEVRASLLSPPKSAKEVAEKLINAHKTNIA